MSRWWPDRACVWLVPHQRQDALQVAEHEIERLSLRPHARLTCVLGGATVRYRIVPWSDALSSPLQRQVLAANCFVEAYGEVARGWTIREQIVRHGAASLACAVDTLLLDGVAALARSRRLQLASVMPSLVQAHNQLRHKLGAGMFWFVWEEGPLTSLLLWSRGEPLHFKTLPSTRGPLATLLDREWFLAGIEGPRCVAYLARRTVPGMAQVSASAGWHIVELPAVDAGVSRPEAAPTERPAT